MKHSLVLYIAVSLVATTAIQAQTGTVNPQCTAGVTQNACQKTIDLFQYMAPQFGILVTGGNAMLGQGGTVGGWGHRTLLLQ
jgi:hypothetical protein